MKTLQYCGLLVLVLILGACGPDKSTADVIEADLVIQVENFRASQGAVIKTIDGISNKSGDSWISFEVEVKEPGRYKTEVFAKGAGTLWVEDYYDNPDGRTYNITGGIEVASTDFTLLGKDGSPLNTGKHNMKLHVAGNGLVVDRAVY